MQYSLFDEMVATLRIESLERPDVQRAMEAEVLLQRSGFREAIASILVRLGVSLDRTAVERVLSAAAGRAGH